MTDRRKSRPETEWHEVRGKRIPVTVWAVKNGKRVRLAWAMGEVTASVGDTIARDKAYHCIQDLLEKMTRPSVEDMSCEGVLDWHNRRIWVLGIKRNIRQYKVLEDPMALIAPRGRDGFTEAFDAQAKAYLKDMLEYEASRGNITLPEGYRIDLGKFRDKFGSYTPKQKRFCFDRRLYCFTPTVIRSVVDHELCHVKNHNHGKLFYAQLYSLMPKKLYGKCRYILTAGKFAADPEKEEADGYQGYRKSPEPYVQETLFYKGGQAEIRGADHNRGKGPAGRG